MCDDMNCMFFFFKQKTAYEIKECDWSSDVCSSDLKTKTILRNLVTGEPVEIEVKQPMDMLKTGIPAKKKTKRRKHRTTRSRAPNV